MITKFTKDTWGQHASFLDSQDREVTEEQAERCCLGAWMGLLFRTVEKETEYETLRYRTKNIISQKYPAVGRSIVDFNDAPSRTWEQVEDVCREAGIPMELPGV